MLFMRMDYVSHGPVTTEAFVPHPGELGMLVFNIIINTYVFLAGMLSVQTARVLLERPFPRYWHGQHQRVEGRMVEARLRQL